MVEAAAVRRALPVHAVRRAVRPARALGDRGRWRRAAPGHGRAAAPRAVAVPGERARRGTAGRRRVGGRRVLLRSGVAPGYGRLMPVGYLVTVALVSWGVACALTPWRRPGAVSAIPALLVSELPFIDGYLVISSTVL